MASLGSLVAVIRVDAGAAMSQVRGLASDMQATLNQSTAAGKGFQIDTSGVAKMASAVSAAALEIQKASASLVSVTTQSQAAATGLTKAASAAGTLAKNTSQVDINLKRSVQNLEGTGRFESVISGAAKSVAELTRRFAELDRFETGRRLRETVEQMNLATGRMNRELIRTRGYLTASVAPLQKMAVEASRLGASMAIAARNTGAAASGLKSFLPMIADIGLLAGSLGGGVGQAISTVALLTRMVGSAGVAFSGFSAGMVSGLAAIAVGAIGAGLAIKGFVSAVTEITKAGLEGARTIENLLISFEALLGGAEAARAEVNSLVVLARESPFLLDTLLGLDRLLISQGVGGIRKELIPAVNDLASAFGLTDDSLRSVGIALSQVFGRGYLSGDELRQLYNQFVPVWEILREIPELANLSQAEIRKMTEEGKVSATEFFNAYISYAQRFKGAADAQADSVNGLLLRLKELSTAALGLSFIQVEEEGGTSPLTVVRDLLREIVEQLEAVNLLPLADAIGNLLDSIMGPITDAIGGTSILTTIFEEWLPKAINFTAIVIEAIIDNVHGVTQAFEQLWIIARQVGPLVGVVFAAGFAGVVAAINQTIAAFNIFISVVGIAIGLVRALFAFVSGGDVGAAITGTIDSVQNLVGGIADLILAPSRGIQAALDVYKGFLSLDLDKPLEVSPDGDQPPGSTADNWADVADKAGGAASAISEAAKAMNELWELTRRFLHQRSELEKGFLGATGFEATADSIIGMAKRVTEALKILGETGAIRIVLAATERLLHLVERREELAERLEAAESVLADAIEARDEFARSLRDSALSFLNALQLEETTEQRWRHIAAQGFFVVEEVRKQQDFAEALAERLRIMRRFLSDIKILRERGLEESLLKQLLTAGPEEAGEIARQLVEGGKEAISKVNVLERQIQTLADRVGKFGAKAFHNAGIRMARAQVEGLRKRLKIVETAAEDIGALIYETVLPFAKKLRDTGQDIGSGVAAGMASGIASGAPGFDAELDKVVLSARTKTFLIKDSIEENLSTAFEDPTVALEGFLGDLDRGSGIAIAKVTRLSEDIQRELEDIEVNIIEWFKIGLPSQWEDLFRSVAQVLFPGLVNIFNFLNAPEPGPQVGQKVGSGGAGNLQQITGAAVPEVKVYIGETELKDMISTEMVVAGDGQARQVIRGRR